MDRQFVVNALFVTLIVSTSAAAATTPPCGPLAAHALTTRDGRLPLSVVQSINPRTLFFAALADFSYVKELGLVGARKPPTDCLTAWGAKSAPRVIDSDDRANGGGISHFTVFRTDFDVFVLFRGLDVADGPSSAAIEMDLTNATDAAAFFGQPASADFFVLRGFFNAYKALEAKLWTEIDTLLGQFPAASAPLARLWVVGHSDGASLAQLAAPRLLTNSKYGRNRMGGVFLFGPQRVGSSAFAAFYDQALGSQTARIHYGWDPAWEALYQPSLGLKGVGLGFGICPSGNNKLERVVRVPVGEDRSNACGKRPSASQAGIKAQSALDVSGQGMYAALSAAGGAAAAAAAAPAEDDSSVLELPFLAHHMPAVFFDGLLRVLSKRPLTSACTLQALQLSSCVISSKCSAALRPQPPGKCATCFADATCSKFWGANATGNSCDNAAVMGGALCYGAIRPGIVGLLL